MKKELFNELKESLEQARDGIISKKTLVQIDKSVENFKKNKVSNPINIDKYIGENMKTVAIEDLIISTILTFCENAAELGCPKGDEVDMWFRELPYEDQYKVSEKMMEIEERDSKRFSKEEQEEKGEKNED